MSTFKRVAVLSATIFLTAITALAWQQPVVVMAHGVLDQAHQAYSGSGQIDQYEPVGQTFKPALSTIVAVDVNIGSDPTKESPADVTLRVRDSSISGAVLAFATRRLGPFGSSGGWVHFELPYTLFVSPGQTYVIELLSTNDTHYWRALSPGTYPNGNAIQSGQDVSNLDFTFRTYGRETKAIKGDVDCNGEVNAVDALKVLRHAAGLPVTQAQPCIGIGQPTDYRTVFVGF